MAKKAKNGQRRSTRHAALPYEYRDGWRIQWVDVTGKRKSKAFSKARYGEDAYREAVAELERVKGAQREVRDGRRPRPVDAPTFARFFEDYWAPNRSAAKRSPQDDRSIYRAHLKPFFGDTRLNEITTAKVEAFRAGLNAKDRGPDKPKGLSPNTQRNVLALLSAVLRYAVRLDFVFILPRISKPKVYVKSFRYLKTDAEVRAFLKAARAKSPGVHALYATAIYSGLRAGELFGLRWTDVDFQERFLTVQRSFNKPPKGGHVRHVPIFDALLPILREWRLQNPNELVFPNHAGHMHTPNPQVIQYARRYRAKDGTGKKTIKEEKGTLGEVLDAAKLPRLRFHDLRHTFASHFVMRGGDLFMLQKILGHSSQQMVQRYAHLAPEAFDSVRGLFGADASAGHAGEVRSFNRTGKAKPRRLAGKADEG